VNDMPPRPHGAVMKIAGAVFVDGCMVEENQGWLFCPFCAVTGRPGCQAITCRVMPEGVEHKVFIDGVPIEPSPACPLHEGMVQVVKGW